AVPERAVGANCDAFDGADLDQVRDIAGDDESILRLKTRVGTWEDRFAATNDLQDLVLENREVGGVDRLADQRGVRRPDNLRAVFAHRIAFGNAGLRASRKQTHADERHVEDADGEDDETDGRDFEHPHRLHAGVLDEAVHSYV